MFKFSHFLAAKGVPNEGNNNEDCGKKIEWKKIRKARVAQIRPIIIATPNPLPMYQTTAGNANTNMRSKSHTSTEEI